MTTPRHPEITLEVDSIKGMSIIFVIDSVETLLFEAGHLGSIDKLNQDLFLDTSDVLTIIRRYINVNELVLAQDKEVV